MYQSTWRLRLLLGSRNSHTSFIQESSTTRSLCFHQLCPFLISIIITSKNPSSTVALACLISLLLVVKLLAVLMQREMLEYEWGGSNAGGEVILSGESSGRAAAEFMDHYQHGQLQQGTFLSHPPPLSLHPQPALYAVPPPPANAPSGLPGILTDPPYCLLAPPKREELRLAGGGAEHPARIGLNLGGRTYFASSSEEDDFLGRLYRRCRAADVCGGVANQPRCQAEGCMADLMQAKHYHRRHKVCEFHSKAATVVAAGLTQRFCQQCSRFHLLSEFDHGKRSCRKRLADHNRRRRKTQPHANHSGSSSPVEATTSSTTSSSSPNYGASRSLSVTIAVSTPLRPHDRSSTI